MPFLEPSTTPVWNDVNSSGHGIGVGKREAGHEAGSVLSGVDPGDPAVVVGLHDHLRPVGVDGLSEAPQSVDHPIVGQCRLVACRGPVGKGNRRCLQDEEPGAAPGPAAGVRVCGCWATDNNRRAHLSRPRV